MTDHSTPSEILRLSVSLVSGGQRGLHASANGEPRDGGR